MAEKIVVVVAGCYSEFKEHVRQRRAAGHRGLIKYAAHPLALEGLRPCDVEVVRVGQWTKSPLAHDPMLLILEREGKMSGWRSMTDRESMHAVVRGAIASASGRRPSEAVDEADAVMNAIWPVPLAGMIAAPRPRVLVKLPKAYAGEPDHKVEVEADSFFVTQSGCLICRSAKSMRPVRSFATGSWVEAEVKS